MFHWVFLVILSVLFFCPCRIIFASRKTYSCSIMSWYWIIKRCIWRDLVSLQIQKDNKHKMRFNHANKYITLLTKSRNLIIYHHLSLHCSMHSCMFHMHLFGNKLFPSLNCMAILHYRHLWHTPLMFEKTTSFASNFTQFAWCMREGNLKNERYWKESIRLALWSLQLIYIVKAWYWMCNFV